jgi:hypothetical protein
METGWLKQSLREATEAAKQIPEWARQVLDAQEAYYGPQSSRLRHERADQAHQPAGNAESESAASGRTSPGDTPLRDP